MLTLQHSNTPSFHSFRSGLLRRVGRLEISNIKYQIALLQNSNTPFLFSGAWCLFQRLPVKHLSREDADFGGFIFPGVRRQSGFPAGMFKEGFPVPAVFGCYLG